MKHLVFDFDGTIVDNFGLVSQLVHQFFDKEGIKFTKSDKEFRQLGVQAAMKELKISKVTLLRMVFTIKNQIRQRLFQCHPHAAVKKIPPLLHQSTRLFILSTNKRDNIEKYLTQYGMIGYFDEIVEDHSYFGKASGLERIQRVHHVDPRDMYYVGDESRDVDAARKAGCLSVAALWGFEGEKVLRAARPDFIIRQPKDLLTLARQSESS